MKNYIPGLERRSIITCNYTYSENKPHPNRIMTEHDLLLILDGEWDIYQDDILYHLVPGDVILLQAHHHHYGVIPCNSTVKTVFIHFNYLDGDGIVDDNQDVHALKHYYLPMVKNHQNNPAVFHLFKQIVSVFWSRDNNSAYKSSTILDLLLCELEQSPSQPLHTRSKDIEKIIHYINSRQETFFTIDELADFLGISGKTLSTHFKLFTGESVHQYQLNHKLEMAKDLILANPQITLKELASTYGFYDEYHFNKCFKKKFGYSPKKRN